MAETHKVLGQSNPTATTATVLYTVPAATQAVVSTLSIATLTSASATFRVAIRVAGAALSNAQHIAYDVSITGNDSVMLTLGLSLGTGDIVSVYASTGNVAFSLFGVEIT
jgi:hypothetical protein